MVKLGRRAALLLGAALSLLVIGACGDDDEGDGGDGAGATGGEITIGTVGPDESDPVLFLSTQALQAFQLAYVPLVTYAHEGGNAGTEIIPGLAVEVPEPTNDGKTYQFRLREGLRYSDGSAVKASDFENTIKRLLKLGSPWSGFFTGIEGAAEFTDTGNFKADIPGIETNDRTGEITIRLTEPDTKVLFALAEPYAARII